MRDALSEMKEIVIFIGPPGAGKGTLARLCSGRLGWTQLSTGDLCRQHITQRTEVGQQIDLLIKSGKLIPDDLVLKMVKEWLQKEFKQTDGIILDGFPRTQDQAKQFDIMLRETLTMPYKVSVVQMELDNELVVRRLTARVICSDKSCQAVFSVDNTTEIEPGAAVCRECASPLIRREDDVEPVIRERLSIYQRHAADLIEYYKLLKNPIYSLDVTRPVEDVFEQFMHLKKWS